MPLLRTLPALLLLAACTGKGGDTGDTGVAFDPTAITLAQVTVGDLTFDARVAGPEDGELVLLLHGFPETSYEWRDLLPVLGGAGYRAVAPDQRGYSPGARPDDVAAYSIDQLDADVVDIADALGADTFHLVGHDWGSAVAWTVAAAYPERVQTLTAVSVPHVDAFSAMLADHDSCQYAASSYFDFFVTDGATDFFVNNDAAQLRAIYEGIPDDAVDEYVSALGTPEAMDGALNWYRANVEDRNFTSPPIGPTTVPTLFVWSDADSAICQDTAELTASYVTADYRYEVYPDITHWVADTAGDTLAADVLEWVGGGG